MLALLSVCLEQLDPNVGQSVCMCWYRVNHVSYIDDGVRVTQAGSERSSERQDRGEVAVSIYRKSARYRLSEGPSNFHHT